MSVRVSKFAPLPPEKRVTGASDIGYFYAGEAARILGVPEIRYSALRAIYNLVREQRGAPIETGRRWARFTSRDLAGAFEVIRLCVDRDALGSHDKTRILLARLERACIRLRRQGFTDPLLQARLDMVDGRVIATVNGVTFDTTTGQLVIAETFDRVRDLVGLLGLDADLLAALERERLQVVNNAVASALGSADDPRVRIAKRAVRRAS